ncbi:MAG: ACP phosphodiesterase [Cyanobacteria bacterium P01_A01_bin.40]
MNWLAHLLLAEPNPEARLGNLLGDLVKGETRKTLSPRLQRGLQCHQAIDSFTDRHLIVKRSKSRIDSQYRRFSGILIDVFYDYVLANNWRDYSDISLTKFTTTLYASWSDILGTLPLYSQRVIYHMMAEDWLLSYQTLAGIENTLGRISYRLNRRRQRNYDLTSAISELSANYFDLEQDFQDFFPQLKQHVDRWHAAN